jgi:hypothetical protein
MPYDWDIFKEAQKVTKIFDADGNVCEDSVVACKRIISFDNVVIFVYDDQTIQIMVDNQPKYDLSI